MRCEWEEVRLGEVIITNINSFSISEQWDFVNYLDTGNITENKIDTVQYIDLKSKEKLPSRAKRKVEINDIIYSTVRPIQKHYGIIKEHIENLLVSTGFTTITTKPQANSKFIYYFLTKNETIQNLQSLAEQSVSTYPSIKASDIENLIISLPPLETQKKIASILSVLDDKIELNNAINKNLEEQAQALFKSWFVDFEPFGGVMPSGWEEGSLLDIADYLNGLAMQKFRPLEDEIGLPVLKIKELRQGMCDNNSDLCSPNIKPEYIIEDGDVIFSWSGSLLVDFWCGGTCGLNQHLFKVSSSKYDKWFYYSWTNHHLLKFTTLASAMATTMGHIKRDELSKAEVFIPNKQDYIKIGEQLKPIYELIILNRIENKRLSEARDTLLPKLMSGELDVSEIDF